MKFGLKEELTLEVNILGVVNLRQNNFNLTHLDIEPTWEINHWLESSDNIYRCEICNNMVEIVVEYLSNSGYSGMPVDMQTLQYLKQFVENGVREDCIKAGYEPSILHILGMKGWKLSFQDYKELKEFCL